ncbi:MAG: Cna B-type domain-containing protein, partial [Erysipelotrichaceae bacterium]|nr:Cna B-type domain-containing protein [Erysipelotrichaceae bacterium]
LQTNVTYTLKETVAPDGYAVTTDTTFVINPNGSVTSTGSKSSDGTLLVEDDKTSVKVSKVDVNNGKEVAGAHIQIIDKNSKVVEEWDSTTTPHEIKGLITGETYILRETNAPTGYVTTTDTTFILNADGSVDTLNSTTKLGDGTYGKNGVLLVEDDLIRTSVAGTKTWSDKLNQDNKRPTSITIRLYADGNEIDHKVVTATDNWSWNWTNLPEYSNGKKIEYKISEDTVDGYTSIVTGFNVENKYTPDQVQVQGNKDWDDNNNQDGIRPTTITVRLFANGTEIDHKDVTAKDNWEWNWTGLDKNSNGQPITYTVKEDTISNYNTVITGYNIKNSHGPDSVT